MNTNTLRIAAATIAVLLLSTTAEARRCDGIHGCLCGVTQARHFGFPKVYNGFNLALARDWIRAFPRTTPHPGAVVYQTRRGGSGHVSRIVSVTGQCSAIVADEKGQYERNICARSAVYVEPGGGTGGFSYTASAKRRGKHKHSEPAFMASVDRFGLSNAH